VLTVSTFPPVSLPVSGADDVVVVASVLVVVASVPAVVADPVAGAAAVVILVLCPLVACEQIFP
jgi:hypothetical protein